MELTERQWAAVVAGRKAMAERIMQDYPLDANALLAVAVTGAFAEMCTTSSTAEARAVIDIINTQLREAGLRLVPLPRN
jgi:hypothetical protein